MQNRIQFRQWPGVNIKAFELWEGADESTSTRDGESYKRWTIRELLSTQALVAEGRQLNHCVASYTHSCQLRRTSIWTMELESESGVAKLLTVELKPDSRTIVQARGKLNRLPSQLELKILQRWAATENLRLSL